MQSITETTVNFHNKLYEWKHKDRRCESCIAELCGETDASKCENRLRCACKCGVGSTEDKLKKAATISGGIALFAGGTALAIMAAPVALPVVLVGGMIGSAGASAAIHGVQKSVSKEKITKSNLTFDMSVGAVSGLLTAGIATGVGAVASAVVGSAAQTTTTVGIYAGTGVINGVTNKAVTETATVVVGDKDLDEWGQSSTGRKRDTLKEWTIPIATGAIGGVVGISTVDVSKVVVVKAETLAIPPKLVNGMVSVGGAVVKEGTKWGIKKVLSENPEDVSLAHMVIFAGTSVGMETVKFTCGEVAHADHQSIPKVHERD